MFGFWDDNQNRRAIVSQTIELSSVLDHFGLHINKICMKCFYLSEDIYMNNIASLIIAHLS